MASPLRVLRPERAGTLPSLEDDPEYAAERDKLRALKKELSRSGEAIRRALTEARNPNESRAKRVKEAVAARLAGRPVPVVQRQSLEELEVQDEVIRAAFAEQAAVVAAIRDHCATEILNQARPAHEQLLKRVLDAAAALSNALDEEADFREAVTQAGASPNVLPDVSDLRAAIGSRRDWGSRINTVGRRVCGALGRQWDHSRVRDGKWK